jgi:hypothetical protein
LDDKSIIILIMIYIVFISSSVLCALFLALRIFEIKRQKLTAISEIFNYYDVESEELFGRFVEFLKKKKSEIVFFITHHIPFHAWNKTRQMTKGLRVRYERIERTVRGRNMIRQAGEASEFMKSISEVKRKNTSLNQ